MTAWILAIAVLFGALLTIGALCLVCMGLVRWLCELWERRYK